MRKLSVLTAIVFSLNAVYAQRADVKKEFNYAQQQATAMLQQIPGSETTSGPVMPRTFENGKLKLVTSRDWTSGFFPGILWYLYDYTKDQKWLNEAKVSTSKLEKEQFNKGTHDLGFMIYCSYGNGYRLTKNEDYKTVIIQAAKSLSTRFNPKVGLIRSWDHNGDIWKYPVIIDNMMNLELLFEATKFSGDSSFYKIAVSHADNTLKNHFRADASSFHVVDYNPETGAVNEKVTHQGYANNSAWARGQAWGLYGFTMCYRFTHDKRYLEQANKIASFILNNPNLPKDLVPYWDYNDPAIPNTSRDASAAAITASALYELAKYSNPKLYQKKADAILKSLSTAYHTPVNAGHNFILVHSTGHRPAKSEIDVPLNYADYYYLEALLRSRGKGK